MSSINDITGASQVTKPTTDEYRKGWEEIFDKNLAKHPTPSSFIWVSGEKATDVDYKERN